MYIGRFVGLERLPAWLASGLMPAEEELIALVEGMLLDEHGNRVARQGLTQCACLTDTALHFWLPEEARSLRFPLRSISGITRTTLDKFHQEITVGCLPAGPRPESSAADTAGAGKNLALRFTLVPQEDAVVLDRLLSIGAAAAHRYHDLGLPPQVAARQVGQVMLQVLPTELPPADAARISAHIRAQLRRPPTSDHSPEPQADDALTSLLTLFLARGFKVLRQVWQEALGDGENLLEFDRQTLHEVTLALQALNSLVGTVAKDPEVRQLIASFLATWGASGSKGTRQETSAHTGESAAPTPGETSDEDPKQVIQDWLSTYAANLERQNTPSTEPPPAPKSIPLGRRKPPQAKDPSGLTSAENGV